MADIDKTELPVVRDNRAMGWGSDVAAELLRRLDIKYIALNPGASYRGLHDSLVNYLGNREPQMLLCLHEDHAVAIAHGYAKASGEAMGVALHANVGLMHGLMGIFNAWCDRVPMLILGATGPVDAMQRRPWIDWIHTSKDQGALLRSFVKWDDEPRSPGALVDGMLRAASLMRTEPRGPVYVCLDAGLQEAALESEVEIPPVERFGPADPPQASADAITRAAELLLEAERPVLLMGRASRSQESWDQRVRLAELLAARVVTDLKTAAVFPTNHGLHVGGPALRTASAALDAVRDADVLLSLDWVDLAGLFKTTGEKIGATVINCSLEPYVQNGWSMDHFGLAPADVAVLAQPESFTAQLLAVIEERLAGRPKWNGAPNAAAVMTPPPPADKPADAAIAPADLGPALNAVKGDRRISLSRLPIGWDGATYPFTEPLDYLGYDGGAGLGSGTGNTIGAALALKDSGRIVVAVLGDGDFLQGATALWTAARYDIPALFVISNNRSNFNDEIHQEVVANARARPVENRWIGQRIDEPPVDLSELARAQGLAAPGPVSRYGDLRPALEEALAIVESGRPCLLDVIVKPGYSAPPSTSVVAGRS